MTPLDYIHYVENPSNGLLIEQRINGVNYRLQYQPIEYCVMLEKKSLSIPSDIFKSEYDRFKGLEHYIFRMNRQSIDSIMDKMNDTVGFKRKLTEYFDFKIQKDIKLVEGTDTIPCSICQCESSFGMTPYYTFVLGFTIQDLKKESQADRLFIYSNKVFNTGEVKLLVEGKNVSKIPNLKMI